jgi:hypothetical protein
MPSAPIPSRVLLRGTPTIENAPIVIADDVEGHPLTDPVRSGNARAADIPPTTIDFATVVRELQLSSTSLQAALSRANEARKAVYRTEETQTGTFNDYEYMDREDLSVDLYLQSASAPPFRD